MMPAPRRNSGFTLAEVLVASILLSIVMTAVYTLFHSAIGSWRAVEHDFDAHQDARNVFTVLSRDLNNLLSGAGHLFEGEDDEITLFTVTEPMNVEHSEGRRLLRVRYFHRRSQRELVREEGMVETALPKAPVKDQDLDRTRIKVRHKKDFVLATGVRDFQVRYVWIPVPLNRNYTQPPDPIEPLMAERHSERWGLPQGLEVTLEFEDPDDASRTLTVKNILPVRAPTPYYTMNQLKEMMGSAI